MSAARTGSRQKLRIRYNAPVTLTFSFLCAIILVLNYTVLRGLTLAFFTAAGSQFGPIPFNWRDPLDYLRLFTHILGHADWNHLIGNLSFILLLGPMLEERFGSAALLIMMLITAFVTGILNACFIPAGLMGASGIAFMMILLASFTNFEKNEVPLTFLLIVALYLGREFFAAFKSDDVSEFAHLAGGICGSMFGFFARVPARRRSAAAAKSGAAAAPKNGTASGAKNGASTGTKER